LLPTRPRVYTLVHASPSSFQNCNRALENNDEQYEVTEDEKMKTEENKGNGKKKRRRERGG
jgi:hypothetical protein